MITRVLTREEWFRVTPLFREEFKEVPPPAESAAIVVVEDHGRIVAFTVVQILQVVEPTWVDPEYRGLKNAALCKRLFDYVRDQLCPKVQYFFCHTRDPRVGRLLSRWGMRNMMMETWRWVRG